MKLNELLDVYDDVWCDGYERKYSIYSTKEGCLYTTRDMNKDNIDSQFAKLESLLERKVESFVIDDDELMIYLKY